MAIPSSWGATRENYIEPKSSGKKWIVIILVLVLLAAAVFGYYLYLHSQGVSVGLEFNKPDQVLVGQPFTFTISASNYSNQILSGAKFSLLLPDGMTFLGQDPGDRLREEMVGDLGPGSLSQKSFNLIVLDGAQSIKHLQAKFIYKTSPDSNINLETTGAVDVAVGQSAITLSYDIPQNVFSGQEFQFAVHYQNNMDVPAKNLHLSLNYPSSFRFTKSDPQSKQGNTIWDLGTIAKGESGVITVTGEMIGQEQTSFSFSGTLNEDYLGQTYALQTQAATIGISSAPLSLSIMLGDGSVTTVRPGNSLHYKLFYKNNSSVGMQNVVIDAKLSGSLFDMSSVDGNGASFNSLTNTLEWLTANTPALSYISPGGSGSVSFSTGLVPTYPIRRLGDKNFSIKVDGTIQSPTVPDATTANRTISMATLETKVVGALGIQAKAFFRDATSGVLNQGQYPPHVNQPTQYSVHWILKNYATDVSNVQISAYLESGTRFVGVVKSSNDTQPTFNTSTGEVAWTIPFVAATKGVVGDPLEAVFQIENTPASNQLGTNKIEIMSQTAAQAMDTYTTSTITATAPPVTTDMPDDPTVQGVDRRIQP